MAIMTPPILIIDSRALMLLEKDMRDLAKDFASTNKLRKPFERIRDEVVIPSIDENFVVGGRPSWEPISEQTYAKRRNKFGTFTEAGLAGLVNALMDTGQMHRAATAKARFHIRENIMTYGDWPEKRWFAVVHNIKEYARNANIPHRPFTMFQPEDIAAIGEIMAEWMEEMVNRNIRLRYA